MNSNKRKIIPSETPTKDLHQFLIGSVGPRPIAFVSTIDENGVANLAPYSFFNAFSSNPPILVFSSNRRVSNNTTKDTLHNVTATREAVVNVVSYDIVRQMSLASVEFDPDVNEFDKVGLTPTAADIVSAPMVAESPVNMECKIQDIITLGEGGGAGHLIICDVVRMHIAESVLDGDRIDPDKIDLMGRMGRSYYVRASGAAIHSIYQSVVAEVIGFDGLPEFIRHSHWLTGNQIAQIAGCKALPDADVVTAAKSALKDLTTAQWQSAIIEDLANERAESALIKLLAMPQTN